MKEFTIHLSDENSIKVKGNDWELGEDHILAISDLGRITACFNLNNIIGFEVRDDF
jgi:hypothetical protein